MKKQNKKYKAVVIGCGKIGIGAGIRSEEIKSITHAGVYQNHPRIILKGLIDINPKKLKIASQYFPKVPLFNSIEEMFKSIKPDIISVATQPDLHLKHVKIATYHKTKAIFCEKPITESLKEAREMIRICKKNKSLLFIGHQRRFDSLLRKWRDKLKKGLIGDVFQGNCYYYNGLFNGGTHNVDLLRFFLGEVNWVKAIVNEKTSWSKKDKNVDALIVFKNDTRIFFQSLTKNYGFIDFYFYGTKGRLAIKNFGLEVEHRRLIKNKYYKGFYQLSNERKIEGRPRSLMKGVIDHLVACLDNCDKPIGTGEDGLAALKIIFALKKSAENNGKLIRIQ